MDSQSKLIYSLLVNRVNILFAGNVAERDYSLGLLEGIVEKHVIESFPKITPGKLFLVIPTIQLSADYYIFENVCVDNCSLVKVILVKTKNQIASFLSFVFLGNAETLNFRDLDILKIKNVLFLKFFPFNEENILKKLKGWYKDCTVHHIGTGIIFVGGIKNYGYGEVESEQQSIDKAISYIQSNLQIKTYHVKRTLTDEAFLLEIVGDCVDYSCIVQQERGKLEAACRKYSDFAGDGFIMSMDFELNRLLKNNEILSYIKQSFIEWSELPEEYYPRQLEPQWIQKIEGSRKLHKPLHEIIPRMVIADIIKYLQNLLNK